MDRALLFFLLLLPGLAQAVICKTVGADGVVSFSDVPAADCPQGSRIPDYRQVAPQAERAGAVDTGVSARQVKFAGYDSIEIVSPEDGGTVRSNEGRVPVVVRLEPELQQSHFITAYVDGRAYKGRYGNGQMELTDVDPGTHELRIQVSDSKGVNLIDSKAISFTLLRTLPLQVREIQPLVDSGNYVVNGVFLGGLTAVGSKVTIQFPGSEQIYTAEVAPDQSWSVEVGTEPATQDRFDVNVLTPGNLEFKKTQVINPTILKPSYAPQPWKGYTPDGGGISTSPGQTNPAFTPNYKAK
jgi:hypothetical protein